MERSLAPIKFVGPQTPLRGIAANPETPQRSASVPASFTDLPRAERPDSNAAGLEVQIGGGVRTPRARRDSAPSSSPYTLRTVLRGTPRDDGLMLLASARRRMTQAPASPATPTHVSSPARASSPATPAHASSPARASSPAYASSPEDPFCDDNRAGDAPAEIPPAKSMLNSTLDMMGFTHIPLPPAPIFVRFDSQPSKPPIASTSRVTEKQPAASGSRELSHSVDDSSIPAIPVFPSSSPAMFDLPDLYSEVESDMEPDSVAQSSDGLQRSQPGRISKEHSETLKQGFAEIEATLKRLSDSTGRPISQILTLFQRQARGQATGNMWNTYQVYFADPQYQKEELERTFPDEHIACTWSRRTCTSTPYSLAISC